MIRLLLYVIAAAALAALIDLIGRRLAARGDCALHRALILRDTCQGRCPPGRDCRALSTRRHWLFGRQDAACGCADRKLNELFPGLDAISPDAPTSDAPEREDETA